MRNSPTFGGPRDGGPYSAYGANAPTQFINDGFGRQSPVCPVHGVQLPEKWQHHERCRREPDLPPVPDPPPMAYSAYDETPEPER